MSSTLQSHDDKRTSGIEGDGDDEERGAVGDSLCDVTELVLLLMVDAPDVQPVLEFGTVLTAGAKRSGCLF